MKLPEDAVTMKHYLNHDELPFIIIFRKIYDKNFLGEIVSSIVQNLQSVQLRYFKATFELCKSNRKNGRHKST